MESLPYLPTFAEKFSVCIETLGIQLFVRALRHAQAKPEVIAWVRSEFRCPICEASLPRLGHLVRDLEFNNVIGVDVIFFDWKNQKFLMLNVLCWGSGLQIVKRLEEVNAEAAHQALLRCWIAPFGVSMVLIVDQGREFFGEAFSQRLVVYSRKLHIVLEETSAANIHDLDLCITETQIARNRRFHRSGFSPYQRAFGVNPRLPASLFSDDMMNPTLLQASASSDMQKSWEIRDAAATAWVRQQDVDAMRRSVKAMTRQADMKQLSVGDWVFVWRSIPGFTGWSGPGVVLAIWPTERSLWISLRGHLLKASREHLRPATSEEHLGAELIRELSSETGRARNFHGFTSEPTPDQDQQLEITTEAVSDEQKPADGMHPSLPAIPEHEQLQDDTIDEPGDISMAPTTPIATADGEEAIVIDEIERDLGEASTAEPSRQVSQLEPQNESLSTQSRRSSIVVDEGAGGVLRSRRVSRADTPRVPAVTTHNLDQWQGWCDLVERQKNWPWRYVKVKTSPGQVEFRNLNPEHKAVFQKARDKEVQSLLDNKAIKILPLEESREFKRQHPECVLGSRYVDRCKPKGDKFAVLPESFDAPNCDPLQDEDISAKSRWCIGWMDPLVHSIERSAPTPLTTSLYSFFQLSATRRWRGKVKDAKTAFLQWTTCWKLVMMSMPDACSGWKTDSSLQDEPTGTAYAGRRVQQMKDFSYVYSMDDYVQGLLKPVSLERKILVKNAKATPLNASEEAQLRGTA
eukprot:s3579_g21.t1